MKNKFELFFSRCYNKEEKNLLFEKAILSYGMDKDSFYAAQILRTDSGKPYFEGLNIYFNISHSQDIWACLIGPGCCGLDFQYIKPCNFQKIAGRFFSCSENIYVEQQGITGFFDIWARREAYSKYTGEGFFGNFDDFVDLQGMLKQQVGNAILKEIKVPGIKSDYRCICCLPYDFKGEMIEVKKVVL